jgi:hypothetical protein
MIKIPNNRAIELLQARLKDLDDPNTDIAALKNRIRVDIELIFGHGSTQSTSAIDLDTLHFDDPAKLAKIKKTYRQTLQGHIDFINDIHIINQEKIEISEEAYKKKYQDLLAKWNDLVPDYNKLLKDYESLHKNL